MSNTDTKRPHELLQFFAYAHLPPHLQAVSQPFGDTAEALAAMPIGLLEDDGDSLVSSLSREYDCASPANHEATWAVVKIGEARHALPRLDMALRKLLEAKDCAVRAVLYKP